MKREELAQPSYYLALCCGCFTIVILIFFASLTLEIYQDQTQLHPAPSEGKLTLQAEGTWVITQELDPENPEGTQWLSGPRELAFLVWDRHGDPVEVVPISPGDRYDSSSEERKTLYRFEWLEAGTGRYSFELPAKDDIPITVGFTHGFRWSVRDSIIMSLIPVLVPGVMTLFFFGMGRYFARSKTAIS